jgi:Holliday junction resolvase RusA-like endonuclease
MKTLIRTQNCDQNNCYLFAESANSEIEIDVKCEKIVSVQSRNAEKVKICSAIQDKLSKFKWIVAGSVNIEICWYLSSTERQETDKVGDLDNITKPIIDSLTGIKGILFDDSQIASLQTLWLSRNEEIPGNSLHIHIYINNDTCMSKENLYFIQYAGPVCLPINVDFNDAKSILGALAVVKGRRAQRTTANRIKNLGENVDYMLVVSTWDIHRTRLGGFDKAQILSYKEFKRMSLEKGFTWRRLRTMWTAKKKLHA